jgi:hypothetical protein
VSEAQDIQNIEVMLPHDDPDPNWPINTAIQIVELASQIKGMTAQKLFQEITNIEVMLPNSTMSNIRSDCWKEAIQIVQNKYKVKSSRKISLKSFIDWVIRCVSKFFYG